MYVSMHVCLYVCTLFMYVLHAYACMYVCTHVPILPSARIYNDTCVYIHRIIYIYIFMCTYIWRLLICRWTYSLVVGATRGQQGEPDRSAATFAFGRPGHDRHGLSISAPGGLQNRRGDKRMLYHSCCELEWAQAGRRVGGCTAKGTNLYYRGESGLLWASRRVGGSAGRRLYCKGDKSLLQG